MMIDHATALEDATYKREYSNLARAYLDYAARLTSTETALSDALAERDALREKLRSSAMDYLGLQCGNELAEDKLRAERDDALARAERAERDLAGWRAVAVVAAIPLEAMRMGGSYRALAPTTQTAVDEAVVTIRMAVSGHSLPPEGDIDAALGPARAALNHPEPVEGGSAIIYVTKQNG